MSKCSRCGTLDERHTKDCYDAMILGWALGIEKRDESALETRLRTMERSIDAIATMLAEEGAAAAMPEFGMDSIEMTAAEVVAAVTGVPYSEAAEVPVTHLPPGYYDPAPAAPAPESAQASEPETEPAVTTEPEPAPIPEPTPAPEPRAPLATPTIAAERWLNDEAIDDPEGRIVIAHADEVYAAWAAGRPEVPATVSGLTIAKSLKGRGYKRRAPIINGRQYPAYYGVRLKNPERVPDGQIRETAPEEHVAIVERYVTARTAPKDGGFVRTTEMYASYQRWCERTGQPDIGRDQFSVAMGTLGTYPKRNVGGGASPAGNRYGYVGVELTPEPLASAVPEAVPDNQTIRKAIKAAKDARRAQVKAEEEAAQEAESAPAPPVIYRVREPEPPKRPDNNGWGKDLRTDGVVVPTLTVEDIAAEHAAIETVASDKYQGPRPGPKMDGETAELVNAILDLNVGWTFQPAAGRQSHTYLIAPDGERFSQASSMGGSVGRIGNNRVLRRYLSRHGYLPTAGAPAAELTLPGTTTVKAKSTPKVQKAPTPTRIEVEAEPDARPLTEEEMDKALFDLYVDVRSGYDGPFSYHPDVESLQGLVKEDITTAVRQPERVEVRPESKDKGYPVIKFAKGDVNVIMGYRDRKSPAVIRAEWGWLLGHDTYQVDRHGGGGSKAATSLPNSYNQLKPRLVALGATVTPNDDGKTAVVAYRGQELGLVTKEKCPRATTHSDWNRMVRKIQAIDRRVPAAV